MLTTGAIQLMLAVIQAAPPLIAEIQADIGQLANNATDEATLVAKWGAMQKGWDAAKAAWQAAAAPVAA